MRLKLIVFASNVFNLIFTSLSAPIDPRRPETLNENDGEPPLKTPRLSEPRCKPTVSEIYLDLGAPSSASEFIELKLNCASKAGASPKNVLGGFKIIVIRADPPTIVTFIDFDRIIVKDLTAKRQLLVLSADQTPFSDVSLRDKAIQSVFKNSASQKVIPDGSRSFAILIIHEVSKRATKQLELPLNSRGEYEGKIVSESHANLIRAKATDMVVVGNDGNSCKFFHSIWNSQKEFIAVPDWKGQLLRPDFSLNFCDDSFSGFRNEGFKLAVPSPGKPNICSGAPDISNPRNSFDRSDSCKRSDRSLINFSGDIYNKIKARNPNLDVIEACRKFLPQRENILAKSQYISWLDVALVSGQCRFFCFTCNTYFSLGFRPDIRRRPDLTTAEGYFSLDVHQNSRIIKSHEESLMHKESVQFVHRISELDSSSQMTPVIDDFLHDERIVFNATMNVLTMVYIEAKTSMSFMKHDHLMEGLRLIGANVGIHHHTNVAAQHIVAVIATKLHEEKITSMQNRALFFSLLCDGSTNQNEAFLICYFQTTENGREVVQFYALIHLSEGEKGLAMANSVKRKVQLDDRISPGFEQYFREYLVTIISDGASNMVGEYNSFKSHMIQYVGKNIPNVKCWAHKLDLAVKNGLKPKKELIKENMNPVDLARLKYFETFEDYTNQFVSFYVSRGHKKWQHFLKVAEELGVVPRKLKRFIKVRWSASHFEAMISIEQNYEAMVVDLLKIVKGDGQFDKAGREIANKLHHKLTDKAYAVTVREFLDFLYVIKEVSVKLQKATAVIIGQVELVYTAMEKLRELASQPGKYLKKFLASCECPGMCSLKLCTLTQYESCTAIKCGMVTFQNNDPSGILLSKSRKDLYENLETGIKSYFDLGLNSAFELFDPNWIQFPMGPVNPLLQATSLNGLYRLNSKAHNYGVKTNALQKLQYICNFYFLPSRDCKSFEEEMFLLIRLIIGNTFISDHKTMNPSEFWRLVASQGLVSTPLMTRILQYVFVTPPTSSQCERGFSFVNSIRTKERSNMDKKTLEMLVRIKENGPTVQTFNSFKYAREFFRTGYVRADDMTFNGGRPMNEDMYRNDPSLTEIY